MPHRILACVLVLLAAVLLAGCASYELTEIPTRRADLYPLADRRGGIALAVDPLGDARRSKRFFGADLREHGILPVEVVVSNHGSDRVAIGPADVLMLRGSSVIDPLPLESVGEIVKDRFLPVSPGTKREVERVLGEVALRQTVVAPGQSYQGVVFFDAVQQEEGGAGRFFRMLRAYPRALFQVHVGVTELDSRRRTRFGPFPVYPRERR
jgi:hypothetical protein